MQSSNSISRTFQLAGILRCSSAVLYSTTRMRHRAIPCATTKIAPFAKSKKKKLENRKTDKSPLRGGTHPGLVLQPAIRRSQDGGSRSLSPQQGGLGVCMIQLG